jgi:glutathione reductase (NADPH)
MIQLAAVAVKAGITKQQWDSTIALHPTAAEELVLMREPVPTPPA